MLKARVVLRRGREMNATKRSLLQLVAATLAVGSRSPSQQQDRVDCQPTVQSQGAIAKLLAPLTIAAFATL